MNEEYTCLLPFYHQIFYLCLKTSVYYKYLTLLTLFQAWQRIIHTPDLKTAKQLCRSITVKLHYSCCINQQITFHSQHSFFSLTLKNILIVLLSKAITYQASKKHALTWIWNWVIVKPCKCSTVVTFCKCM